MNNLFWIFLVCCIAALFWQQRKQTEYGQSYIRQRCKQLNLQLLSIARGNHAVRRENGKMKWQTTYFFEFSADGSDAYQGYAVLEGFRLKRFHVPPHHLPAD